MHLSVLSQIILPQNAVKIRVLTFFGNVYSRRNGKLCIDRRKMAPPHLLPLPSPSEEEIFFNRMQNRTNCCENRERDCLSRKAEQGKQNRLAARTKTLSLSLR
jgi:hypothetical protein